MAISHSHKFGQIVGNLLEELVEPYLSNFAKQNNMFLDCQKNPRTARKGKRVTWIDQYGNKHNLDYVIERNGSKETIGTPVAFVETAWRSYTKHSRNKTQEIQGAILPLAEKYHLSNPLLGAILAGTFTDAAQQQLRSLNFQVAYFPHETFAKAFEAANIDIRFNEKTPENDFRKCVKKIESLSSKKIDEIKKQIGCENQERMDNFIDSLRKRLDRMIEKIIIVPLYGTSTEFLSLADAIDFLESQTSIRENQPFYKYELLVAFSNGDRVEGSFREAEKARDFLQFVSRQ